MVLTHRRDPSLRSGSESPFSLRSSPFSLIGALVLSALALATGPLAYPLLRRFVKRGQPDVAVPVVGERGKPLREQPAL